MTLNTTDGAPTIYTPLLDEYTLKQVTLLRRMIALSNSHSDAATDPTALTQKILKAMGKTVNNSEFIKVESWIKD